MSEMCLEDSFNNYIDEINSYGNKCDLEKFAKYHTVAIIKPHLMEENNSSKICQQLIQKINNRGLKIVLDKELIFTEEQIRLFYAIHAETKKGNLSLLDLIVKTNKDRRIRALLLKGTVSTTSAHFRDLLGSTNPDEARLENPDNIRALYGKNIDNNAMHGTNHLDSEAYQKIGINVPPVFYEACILFGVDKISDLLMQCFVYPKEVFKKESTLHTL